MKVILEFDTNDEASMEEALCVVGELSGHSANERRLNLARLVYRSLGGKAEEAVKLFMKEHAEMVDSIMDLEYFTLRGDISSERKVVNEILTAIHRASKES